MDKLKNWKIWKNVKFENIENFGNSEIWSYEFHLVLKMISGTFKKIDFVFSNFRFFPRLKLAFRGPCLVLRKDR